MNSLSESATNLLAQLETTAAVTGTGTGIRNVSPRVNYEEFAYILMSTGRSIC